MLYHSVAYNNFRNEYFVVFDVDQNNDSKADRVYGYRVNSKGQILGRKVIDFTLRGASSKPKILVIHFPTIKIVIKNSKINIVGLINIIGIILGFLDHLLWP